MLVNIIGFLAAFTSTISLVPQILHMYRTRSVGDIALGMIINFVLTSCLWIAYGVLTMSGSVWVANSIMLVFSVMMMVFKLRYRKEV